MNCGRLTSAAQRNGRKVAQLIGSPHNVRRCRNAALAALRENRLKQFLPLFGTLPTFQENICRVADLASFGRWS
jgi:hypothetical protein